MDPPYVNGVSPCEGHPGTQIKIWGENLGLSEHDITSIVICGHECIESMDWVSSRKIICNTGHGVGRGRIIITSSSGGVGTCSVYFSGLEPASPASPAIDPNAESDMWLEENWIVPGEQGDMGFHNIASDTPINRPTDPLGINMKRSAPGDTIRQFCPQGSSDLLSEDFNPVVFLLENHCTTSFNQLQSGLSNLKKEVHTSEEAPGQFIKDNLDSFIQCYDTLSDVNELLIRNETESESGSITDKMEILLRDTALQADALFQDLLNRKTKADSTRNALTVLQRYRFLFNLPRSIEMNIKHQEYEIVTNDYERAKSLFAGTKVNVFSKVLREVENLVSRLRDDLLKKLLYNPTSFENQKKFIKYLLDLDYLGDPSWDCIANMQHWILQQLLEAKTTHQHQPSLPLPSIEYTPDSEMLSTHLSGYGHSRTWSNSSGGSVFAVAKGNAPSNKHSDTDTKTSDSKPKRILFVLKLIDIIQSHLPGLFHLGQAYFNRTLFTNMLNENQDSIISENVAIKPDEFNEMIMELTEVYTDLVNNSLFQDAADHLPPERLSKLGEWKPFDDDLAESSGAWLPLCVRKIRGCLSLLQGLPLPPPPLSLIQQLSLNVCTLSADTLFLRTTRDIEALHMREDWRVQDEEGCVITSLPILFENIVIDVLLTLKEIVIETRPGEVFEDRKPLMLASREHYQGLLEDFCNCLSYLAFGDEKEEGSNSQSITRQETIISLSEDALHMPSVEEQLLLILSNSYYTREHVSPRLYECFINHGYPESPEIQERFREQLEELDRRVFDRYLSYKVDPLCNLVGPGMNGGCFKWNGDALPTGIRDYVHEILLYFVQVHAEVSSISEHLTKKVLSQLLEELSFEMLQQFGSVKSFSNPGKLVGYIEVLAIHETLKSYMTQKTMDNFDAMFELVDSIKKKYARNIRDFTEALTDNTSLQFSCFKIAK